jgi:hypothetical protein
LLRPRSLKESGCLSIWRCAMGQDALSAVSDGRYASSGQEGGAPWRTGLPWARRSDTGMPQRRAAASLLPQSGREKMAGTFKKEARDHLGALPRVSLERALRWSDVPKVLLALTWGLIQLSGSSLMMSGGLTCPTHAWRCQSAASPHQPGAVPCEPYLPSCVARRLFQLACVQNNMQFDQIIRLPEPFSVVVEQSSNHNGTGAPGCLTPHTLFLARPLVKTAQ